MKSMISLGVWRNGSASDSRSEGWEFESLCPHFGQLLFDGSAVDVSSTDRQGGGCQVYTLTVGARAEGGRYHFVTKYWANAARAFLPKGFMGDRCF